MDEPVDPYAEELPDDLEPEDLTYDEIWGPKGRPEPRVAGVVSDQPTLAVEFLAARAAAGADITVAVALAVRAGRGARGQSQRAFAADTGMSRHLVEAVETRAGTLDLSVVVEVLAEVGFALGLVRTSSAGTTTLVDPEQWSSIDLLARDRVGKRLPPHGVAHRSEPSHLWWPSDEKEWPRGRPRWRWGHPLPPRPDL